MFAETALVDGSMLVGSETRDPMSSDHGGGFTSKLVQMLTELPTDLISWDAQTGSLTLGKSLEPHLQNYFRHNKMSSLQRQLNNVSET